MWHLGHCNLASLRCAVPDVNAAMGYVCTCHMLCTLRFVQHTRGTSTPALALCAVHAHLPGSRQHVNCIVHICLAEKAASHADSDLSCTASSPGADPQ